MVRKALEVQIGLAEQALHELQENGRKAMARFSVLERQGEKLSTEKNEIVKRRIHIYTAGFKSQLEVRNVAQYHEFASTVAVAIEKDCVAVYGDPIVDDSIIEHFRNRIVRVNDLESLLAER